MNIYVKLYAELNLGDDLFLKILLERYPDINFELTIRKEYEDVFKGFKNLKIYNDVSIKRKGHIYKAFRVLERNIFPKRFIIKTQKNLRNLYDERFKKFDAFISIGGSIFMQPKSLPTYPDVEYYKIVNENFDKVYYLGCNFGPFKDECFKESYTEVFKKATDVCFRDKTSWAMFSQLKNVRYKSDIVFGLDFPMKEKKVMTVGFSIISARNNINKKKYFEKYAELIKFYLNNNYEVYLFSFCKKQGDESAINNIANLLGENKKIKKVFYNGDINNFLKIYSTVEKVYCARFHSMILSMLFGQKIYPIVYSDKMTNVLKDINYKGDFIKIEDLYLCKPKELDVKMNTNIYNISEEIDRSKEQFEKLDMLLKDIKS